jgi:sensor histidine kinase YesM
LWEKNVILSKTTGGRMRERLVSGQFKTMYNIKKILDTAGVPLSPRNYWKLTIAFWGSFAAISYVQGTLAVLVTGRTRLYAETVQWFIHWGLWILITPVILMAAYNFPVVNRSSWKLVGAIAVHLCILTLIFVALTFVEFAIMRELYMWEAGQETTVEQVVLKSLNTYIFRVAIYMLIVLGYNIAQYIHRNQQLKDQNSAYELKTAQLQGELTLAQLQALKMQLKPHFLFNTLNSLVGLMMMRENKKAINMVNSLSAMLRTLVDTKDVVQVPLCQEVEFAKEYLYIQQIRFEDRLNIEWDLDDETKSALVPQYILQPLIENSIIHGIEKLSRPALIRISTECRADGLRIEVLDNGVGFNPKTRSGRQGVGISIVRQRLDRLYGQQASLSYELPERGGTRAVLSMPMSTHSQNPATYHAV